MRKLAAAVLAVPIIAALYVPVLLRRSIAARVGIALGVGSILGVAAIALLVAPSRTEATPPSTAAPLTNAAFRTTLEVDHSLVDPVAVEFSSAMNEASAVAALSVVPTASVTLSWNAAGTTLTVAPFPSWAPSTYYTVTVGPAALDKAGRAIGAPGRAAFLTRPPTAGRMIPLVGAAKRAQLNAGFTLTFDRPVDLASVEAGVVSVPAVPGGFTATEDASGQRVTFTPSTTLAPDTAYTVRLAGQVRDRDHALISQVPALSLHTVAAPSVVRFRPRPRSTDIARGSAVSVRFTQAMSHASAAALTVTVNGKPIAGQISWAEGDTVLVFDPKSEFPFGAKVLASVAPTARSKAGTSVGTLAAVTFTVEQKPAAAAKPKPAASPARKPTRHATAKPTPIKTGGRSIGAGTWAAVESYYLKLMNCTRTGGWVTSGGGCSSPGGRAVSRLWIDAGISNRVSRPYAHFLASRGICSHYADGTPGTRLRRAGYYGDWAENLGCRSGNAYSAVLGSHLFFQAERPCGGYCHYANLMNPRYDRVGLGVYVLAGRVRLVVDFYRP